MLWVGITGPMGSGKSTVANLLRQIGFEVLDADEIARKVLGPGSPGEAEVLQTFGQHLCDKSGRLDRRALGRLVFADKQKLDTLEKIIHPRVREETARLRENLVRAGHKAAFYDVPLLFEKSMQKNFDHVIVVTAGADLRRERLRVRSQMSDEEFQERSLRQLPVELKEAAASAVIHNESNLDDLEQEILHALADLRIPLPLRRGPLA